MIAAGELFDGINNDRTRLCQGPPRSTIDFRNHKRQETRLALASKCSRLMSMPRSCFPITYRSDIAALACPAMPLFNAYQRPPRPAPAVTAIVQRPNEPAHSGYTPVRGQIPSTGSGTIPSASSTSRPSRKASTPAGMPQYTAI